VDDFRAGGNRMPVTDLPDCWLLAVGHQIHPAAAKRQRRAKTDNPRLLRPNIVELATTTRTS
jgi:hypothetical protein